MAIMYEKPELNKMEYTVSELISASGDENAVEKHAYDNETTLNW